MDFVRRGHLLFTEHRFSRKVTTDDGNPKIREVDKLRSRRFSEKRPK